jgi:hypothetical protein
MAMAQQGASMLVVQQVKRIALAPFPVAATVTVSNRHPGAVAELGESLLPDLDEIVGADVSGYRAVLGDRVSFIGHVAKSHFETSR